MMGHQNIIMQRGKTKILQISDYIYFSEIRKAKSSKPEGS